MISEERKVLSANDQSILTEIYYKHEGFTVPTVLSTLGSSYSSDITKSPGLGSTFRYVGTEAPTSNAPCRRLLTTGLFLPLLLISYNTSHYKHTQTFANL